MIFKHPTTMQNVSIARKKALRATFCPLLNRRPASVKRPNSESPQNVYAMLLNSTVGTAVRTARERVKNELIIRVEVSFAICVA